MLKRNSSKIVAKGDLMVLDDVIHGILKKK